MELTNREWSILLWTVTIFGFAFWKAKPWALIKSLLDILTKKVMIVLFGSMTIYVLASVWLLWLGGFWMAQNLKTTIWWTFGFAVVSLFQVDEAQEEPDHFRKIWRQVISVNIFVTFIATTYVFSLPVELAIVPVTTVASMMLVLTDKDPKAASLRRVLNGLLIIAGVALLGNAIWLASHQLRHLVSVETAREFIVPVVLSLLYIPFLYCWHLFLSYERAFGRIERSVKDDKLSRVAKFRSTIAFNTDIDGLGQWLRHIALFRLKSEADVATSIAEIKRLRRRQRQPFRVPPIDGWLPEAAAAFLSEEDLVTKEYHRSYEGWYASSRYLTLGSGVLDNNISYYIEGDELAVRTLRLVLNVNNPEDDVGALETFRIKMSKLVSRAAYGDAGESRQVDVTIDGPAVNIGKLAVRLSKEAYAVQAHGYTLTLVVTANRCQRRLPRSSQRSSDKARRIRSG